MRRLLLLMIVAAALTLTVEPASAHGDEGLLEVVQATPSDVGSTVTYQVSLVYVDDGDPVSGATIMAAAVLGEDLQPAITLDPVDQPGIYEGTVSFPTPGRWTVRFESEAPAARLQATFRVEQPAPATTTSTTTTPAGPVTSTATHPDLADDDTAGGSSGPPAGLVAGLVVTGVAVVLIAVALLIQRRRARKTDAEEP